MGGAGSHLAAVQVLSDVLDGVDAAAEEHDGRIDPPLVSDQRDELAHLVRVRVRANPTCKVTLTVTLTLTLALALALALTR